MNLVIRGILTCLLLTLATGAHAQVERYVEGVHYKRLSEPAAAYDLGATEGQQSVLEVFWYGCGHCYAFDPLLNAWVAGKAGTIHFARTPMIWDATTREHARLFFATRALGVNTQVHDRIFDEIHEQRNYLLDAAAITDLLGEFGIDPVVVARTLASFTLDAELRKADTRLRELAVPSVPALIVNGTWMINTTAEVPTHQAMLDVADFLLGKSS